MGRNGLINARVLNVIWLFQNCTVCRYADTVTYNICIRHKEVRQNVGATMEMG